MTSETKTLLTTAGVEPASPVKQNLPDSIQSDHKNSTLLKPFSGNRPVLRWTGGKYSELKHIVPFLPSEINTLIDPFVGGGSTLYNIAAKRYCINDIDRDLMWFYLMTWKSDLWKQVKSMCQSIDKARQSIRKATFKKSIPTEQEFIAAGIEASGLVSSCLFNANVIDDLAAEYAYRFKRMTTMSIADSDAYIRTGLFAVLYRMIRSAYNAEITAKRYTPKRIAAWFCMRDISFGGMQRFSADDTYNVPYGGASYNNRDMRPRINRFDTYRSGMTERVFDVNCMDFKEFLLMAIKRYGDTPDNFIFLDPPYDTAFSSYSEGISFSHDHYKALRDILLSVKCRFMLVMKVTPCIEDLFMNTGAGWYYHYFDKQYRVNIRNRNNRAAQHVLIMNYATDRTGTNKDAAKMLARI